MYTGNVSADESGYMQYYVSFYDNDRSRPNKANIN